MRQRMIKPDFIDDEITNGAFSFPARLAYIYSWMMADDEGRLRGSISYLRTRLFPYDEQIDMNAIKGELIRAGKWVCYQVHGQDYMFIPKFKEYQTINRPQPSSIPSPNNAELCVNSVNNHGVFSEHSLPNIREVNIREEKSTRRALRTAAAGAAESDLDAFFDEQFWPLYPKKASKATARKALARINPNAELQDRIIRAVNQQRTSRQWRDDNGRYIPHAATWLNGHRWEDESNVSPSATVYMPGERPYIPVAASGDQNAIQDPPITPEARSEAGRWESEFLPEIKERMDAESFETWLEPIKCLGLSADAIWLGVPTEFYRKWVMNNYHEHIADIVSTALDRSMMVHYPIWDEESETDGTAAES